MATNTVLLTVDREHVADALQAARQKLDNPEDELLLDFSSVHRIDTSGLQAMEDLAGAAKEKAAKVALRGVNVEVYKVLKLVKLASRFSFVN